MSDLLVHMVPALSDNYAILVHDPVSGATATIDTPEAAAIENALDGQGWALTHIFNTHHHPDHTGGNLDLKKKTNCVIVGGEDEKSAIPGIDVCVVEGDEVALGEHIFKVIDVGGHTAGHIAFWCADQKLVFVGDALFSLGCGRMFEGTAEQMWGSLQKLMGLPDDTVVYCAHEYTQGNARFALSVEPHNKALVKRVMQIDVARAKDLPTVPTTIGLEKATNPFLRPMSAEIQANLDLEGAALVDVFAETRRLKDSF